MIHTIVCDLSCFSFLCHNWIKVINHFSTDSLEHVKLTNVAQLFQILHCFYRFI